MAYIASVNDGKLVDGYTDNNKEELPKGSELGYDQFLQLLCAEMQYQDPLEPTSNTEYVAQLATFSQLEATIALQSTEQNAMANNLVGKTVIIKVENETTGKTDWVDGKVDYVLYQNNDVYLSVNNALYPLSSLDTVADNEYYEAVGLSKSIENMLGQMPNVENLTIEHKIMVGQITDLYDGMTDYQKQFMDIETVKLLEEYRATMKNIVAAQEAESAGETDTEGTAEADTAVEETA
ncbi:MAG: flagellar hook capping protein [Blautia sp.]|nr:flagellar hook capping protein [Blautia sp.]